VCVLRLWHQLLVLVAKGAALLRVGRDRGKKRLGSALLLIWRDGFANLDL